MHKCHKCLFKDVFRDQDRNVPVCKRYSSLQGAIDAYESNAPCQWYITWGELIAIQEEIHFGRKETR